MYRWLSWQQYGYDVVVIHRVVSPSTWSIVLRVNAREANREINITVNGNRLQFQSAPTYLGVKLDRTLSFRQHLENLSAKTTARVALIRRLAGTTWGAATKTLKVSTLALVYSAAEYCAPVWCRSSHTKKLDTVLNSAMRTVSGCLRATPVNHLTSAGLRTVEAPGQQYYRKDLYTMAK